MIAASLGIKDHKALRLVYGALAIIGGKRLFGESLRSGRDILLPESTYWNHYLAQLHSRRSPN